MGKHDDASKATGAAPAPSSAQKPQPRPPDKSGPPIEKTADGGRGPAGDPAARGKGQGERQGFDRQRLDPQDTPPADVRDDQNLAGEKDFELKPPGG